MSCRVALKKAALLLASSMILTGCASPTREAPEVNTVFLDRTIPASAKEPCDPPTRLNSGAPSELKRALARDGIALLECEERRRAAVEGTP